MLKTIRLKEFTVFDRLEVPLSPKVNVIVGENGTGKTHLLKAAYALCKSLHEPDRSGAASRKELGAAISDKLRRVFFPAERRLGDLVNHGSTSKTDITVEFADGSGLSVEFGRRSQNAVVSGDLSHNPDPRPPIFFPAKEVLSFLPGIASLDADLPTVEMLFDESYLDLCAQLLVNEIPVDLDEDPRLGALIPGLCNAIGGRFEIANGRLDFRPGAYVEEQIARDASQANASDDPESDENGSAVLPQLGSEIRTVFVPSGKQRVPGHTTAEGFKKIGVLQRLLSNGKLAPGECGTLFWDEPEANVNPLLMRLLVEIVLDLSRNGLQIVLASHDYVLLKWLDLLEDPSRDDDVRYHALYKDDDGKVQVESCDEYRLLNRNAISNSFAELYDEEVNRALGSKQQ